MRRSRRSYSSSSTSIFDDRVPSVISTGQPLVSFNYLGCTLGVLGFQIVTAANETLQQQQPAHKQLRREWHYLVVLFALHSFSLPTHPPCVLPSSSARLHNRHTKPMSKRLSILPPFSIPPLPIHPRKNMLQAKEECGYYCCCWQGEGREGREKNTP